MTVTADALPTVQINGVVWQQLVLGTTVYAAGSFSSARPAGAAAGTKSVPRSNLLAYDLATGVLKSGFVANLNAQAQTLAASPDGKRLYVGGNFTTVNGVTRNRVAAVDPTTGTVLAGFAPSVNRQVESIVATGTTVYLGGSFSSVDGNARNRLGAVSATNGALLSSFKPTVPDGTVLAMVLSPDRSKLVVGGSFTSLNSSANPGYGLGSVNPTTGASQPLTVNATVRDAGLHSSIQSLSSDGTNFYGTGYVYGTGGNLEGAFSARWSDTRITWLEDCHGDSYSVYASSTAVYTASHTHFCGNIGGFGETSPRSYHRGLAFSKAATRTVKSNTGGSSYYNFAGQPAPSLQNWFPDINVGTYTGQSQGPWTVTGSGSYVVYGGEFTSVNGTSQQGLVRFATADLAPNRQGPRVSGTDFQPVASQLSADTVKVSWPANWDRDNANLTYTVYQDTVAVGTVTSASSFWNRPTLSLTLTRVPAGRHSYQVVAKDPFGNRATSPTVTNQSPPVVTATTPAAGATGVAVGTPSHPTPLQATFSEDVTGVDADSFVLRRGNAEVAASVSYSSSSRVATLTSAAPLTADTTYTATLTSSIANRSGTALAPKSWTFLTGPRPVVASRTPAAKATEVSRTADITATFSEAVTGIPTSPAATSTFTIKRSDTGTAVAAEASYSSSSKRATLNPAGTLLASTSYTVTLTSGVKDTAGNTLGTVSWSFSTGRN